jgi:hypothetical protein
VLNRDKAKSLLNWKPRRDRIQAKLSEAKEGLRKRKHQPIPEQEIACGKWLADSLPITLCPLRMNRIPSIQRKVMNEASRVPALSAT